MILVVFVSTMSFGMDMHYCGNNLVSVSLFGKANACGMEQGTTKGSKTCSIAKKDCCHNKQLAIDGHSNITKTEIYTPTVEQMQFAAVFFYTYTKLFTSVEQDKNTSNTKYPPPLVSRDIYKVHEVYLI